MDELVTLIVGKEPNGKKYIIHKQFACSSSPVFKSAFNSDFQEGQTQTYRLEDANDGSVQLLVQWLYAKRLDLSLLPLHTTKHQRLEFLVQLWVLSDKLLISQLQTEAIRELFAESERQKSVPTATLNCVYNNTRLGSPLRRLFLQRYARETGPQMSEWYLAPPEQFPKEMMLELATYYSKAINDGLMKDKIQ